MVTGDVECREDLKVEKRSAFKGRNVSSEIASIEGCAAREGGNQLAPGLD